MLDALRADPAGYDVALRAGLPGARRRRRRASPRPSPRPRDADVCVAVLGDQAGLFGRGTSARAATPPTCACPGGRRSCSRPLLATGTPVVLVLLVGRPYELARQADRLAAVVCGFFPGEEGARGAGRRADRPGRPVGPAAGELPRRRRQPAVDLPRRRRWARRSEVSNVDPTPLFPFGHGLSYTAGDVGATSSPAPRRRGRPTAALRRRGDAAQRREPARRPRSCRSTCTTRSPRSPGRCSSWSPRAGRPGAGRDARGRRHAARRPDLVHRPRPGGGRSTPGAVELRVGASSADIRAGLASCSTGPRREVGFDRALTAEYELV